MFTWSDIEIDIDNTLLSSVKRIRNISFLRLGTYIHYVFVEQTDGESCNEE
jgi:hypothetical protein